MIEVYRNTSEYIGLSVYVSGVLTAATGQVKATLKDDKGVVLDVNTNVASTTIGKYRYLLPLQYTTSDRKLKVVWEFLVEGENATRTDDIEVVTPYVTPDEVLATYPELTKSYNEIKDMERFVRRLIDVKTGQNFGSYHDTVRFYGNGRDYMGLSRRIYGITKVWRGGIQIYPYTDSFGNIISSNYDVPLSIDVAGWGFRVNPSGPYYDIKSDVGLFDSNRMGMATGPYFDRNSIFVVEGDFGWEQVPNDINLAAKILVREFFSQDHMWRQKGLSAVQTADWQFQFHDESYRSTGNMHVDEILASYNVPNMVII